jgi:nucleotide-binding universal stress UspA family protein
MLPIRTILFPTDFSDCAACAYPVAAALARDHGARLVLLHVATPPAAVTYGELAKMLQQRDGYRLELEQRLRGYPVPGPGVPVEYRLEDGHPATEILAAVEETGCDLVVMGTHGRTGISRILLGSVAEQVMRRAPCPVVTVKQAPVPARPLPEGAPP